MKFIHHSRAHESSQPSVFKRYRLLPLVFALVVLGSFFTGFPILFAEEMEYVEVRNEKNVSMRFSRLVMGTDHLAQADWSDRSGKAVDESEVFSVLDEAASLGINLFDTAPIYVGDIESKLGTWMESWNKKHPDKKVYALSKGGFPFDLFWSKKMPPGENACCLVERLQAIGRMAEGDENIPNPPVGTYASRLFGSRIQIVERLKEEMAHTIKNLKGNPTVYLMHRDDGDFIDFESTRRSPNSVLTIMEALSSEELAKKYTFLGWSNWKPHRVTRSLKLADGKPALSRPVFNSPYFSLFEMTDQSIHAGGVQATHEEMMDEKYLKGIKMMSYSPLSGFSILDRAEPSWENGRKAAKKKYAQGDPYWKNVYHALFTNANRDRFERALKFTAEFNLKHQASYTVDQLVNAYALAHKRVDFLVVGPIHRDQVRRSVAALKLSRLLTPADLDYLYYGEK